MGQMKAYLILFFRLQCGALLLVSLLCGLLFSWPHAAAYAFGHVLVFLAVLLSAHFALRRAASPVGVLFWALTGVMWKWLLIFAGLYGAFARFDLPKWPLLCGVIAAQLLSVYCGVRYSKASMSPAPASWL
jgi:hypothetical protein